ncbi:50S ribosomal protein L17 [Candidatus Wolfebacteria bacterium]|nr:50S ribosomal protein L17 [Candidatus Wolfebacteria bacterium]
MRHLKKGKKFHREKGQRQALMKSLLANLILREKIETTAVKAKALRREIEKTLSLGKKQNIASLRLLQARLPKKAAGKLYYELAPRYAERHGGYARILKGVKRRKSDNAPMAMIEFV